MVFYFNISGGEVLAFLVACIVIYTIRIKWCQLYWRRMGLPYLEPSYPFGNFGNPFNRKNHVAILVQDMYNELKRRKEKHGGFYSLTKALYLPIDPDLLKNVMQKDFSHFYDRGFYYNEEHDPLSAHLFAISGPKWRHLRTKLTPTFTSGKMKMMFDTLVQCAGYMYNAVQKYEGSFEGIEFKDVLARYTTDVIGSCAFGLDCNSFEHEDSEFRKYGRKVFGSLSKLRMFVNVIMFANPNFAKKIGFKILPSDATKFFAQAIKDTVKYREDNNVRRNDMLQLLIDLKNNALDEQPLTITEIAAQAFVFFAAGFETSSTTMAFCLYELSINPEMQQRVRNEINDVLEKHHGKITYEAIMDMKYMGQVVDETLRKYPPLAFLTRTCVEDYHMPDINLTIEKGTGIFLPILALHHDQEYFPNPNKFDPERFSEENKPKIRPFTYMPFGEGPRLCIGMRFGLMQVKVGLTVLLRNNVISLNKKTASPLNIDRYSFIYAAKDGVWLNLEKYNNPKL